MAYRLLVIPTHAGRRARWIQSVDLSGVRYRLYFSWNTRMGSWHMSVLGMDGRVLLGGIRLVPEIDLLGKHRAGAPGLPPGKLRVLDRQGDRATAEVGRSDFGARYVLSYAEGA